jgi:hypothetical protein
VERGKQKLKMKKKIYPQVAIRLKFQKSVKESLKKGEFMMFTLIILTLAGKATHIDKSIV